MRTVEAGRRRIACAAGRAAVLHRKPPLAVGWIAPHFQRIEQLRKACDSPLRSPPVMASMHKCIEPKESTWWRLCRPCCGRGICPFGRDFRCLLTFPAQEEERIGCDAEPLISGRTCVHCANFHALAAMARVVRVACPFAHQSRYIDLWRYVGLWNAEPLTRPFVQWFPCGL